MEEVASPLKPTVFATKVIGQVAVIAACLLLKVDQSVPERQPVTPAEAVVQPKLPPAPPICEPIVPENVIGADTPSDEVLTLANVFTPEK
jgi:hypothetical protein